MRKFIMHPLNSGLLCANLVLASLLCSKDSKSPLAAPGKMTIGGSVTQAGSGEPIAGATVRLIKLLD